MEGSILQVECLFEMTVGGRLTGQINIWRFPTSPHGLSVTPCFTTSLVKGMGCIYYAIGTFKPLSLFFYVRRTDTWVRMKKEQLPFMYVVNRVRRN